MSPVKSIRVIPCMALPTAELRCSSGALSPPVLTSPLAPGFLSPSCLPCPMAAFLSSRTGAGPSPTPIWTSIWRVWGMPGTGGGSTWKCLCGWREISMRFSLKSTAIAGAGGETEKLWHDCSPKRGTFLLSRFRGKNVWAKYKYRFWGWRCWAG